MPTFAVVAHTLSPTNARLGTVLSPAQAAARLRPGDVALGRLDVLRSLDGIEPGAWALDLLAERGVTVLNGHSTLATAHDKLATANALRRAGLPSPETVAVAPWLLPPQLEPPFVLKPRFGSWGRDVLRCEIWAAFDEAVEAMSHRIWFNTTGGVVQRLIPPAGHDLRVVVAGGRVVGAVNRVSAPGEWRTNVALGARRIPTSPSREAAELAVAAAAAVGGDLVGVDLLPCDGRWTVLEVNGAVDFTGVYSSEDKIFASVRAALALPDSEPAIAGYAYA